MPLVGSILVIGTARQSGGTFACDRCKTATNRAWTIKCANYGHEGVEHTVCGPCLTSVQVFACADPADAAQRLQAAAARATPNR